MHLSLCWTLPCLATLVASAPTGGKQTRGQASNQLFDALSGDANTRLAPTDPEYAVPHNAVAPSPDPLPAKGSNSRNVYKPTIVKGWQNAFRASGIWESNWSTQEGNLTVDGSKNPDVTLPDGSAISRRTWDSGGAKFAHNETTETTESSTGENGSAGDVPVYLPTWISYWWNTKWTKSGKAKSERRSFHWLPAWRTEPGAEAAPDTFHWQKEPGVEVTPTGPKQARGQAGISPVGPRGVDLNNSTELAALLDSDSTPLHNAAASLPQPSHSGWGWTTNWNGGKSQKVDNSQTAHHARRERRSFWQTYSVNEPGSDGTPEIQPAQHTEPGASEVPSKDYGDCPGNWCRPVRRRSLISRLLARSRGTPQPSHPVQNTAGVAAALAAEKEFAEAYNHPQYAHQTQNTVPVAIGAPHAPDGSGVKHQGDCPGNWCRPVKE